MGDGRELVELRARIHSTRLGIAEPDDGKALADRRKVFELAAAGVLAAASYRQWAATWPGPLTVAEV